MSAVCIYFIQSLQTVRYFIQSHNRWFYISLHTTAVETARRPQLSWIIHYSILYPLGWYSELVQIHRLKYNFVQCLVFYLFILIKSYLISCLTYMCSLQFNLFMCECLVLCWCFSFNSKLYSNQSMSIEETIFIPICGFFFSVRLSETVIAKLCVAQPLVIIDIQMPLLWKLHQQTGGQPFFFCQLQKSRNFWFFLGQIINKNWCLRIK